MYPSGTARQSVALFIGSGADTVAWPSGQNWPGPKTSSLGGRGPNSPDGPHGPLHGAESAEIRSPAFQRRAPE
eukprot:3051538-Alexandrium_andersonii.AAC.1